jgi:NADH:ubiquinone oxidoreductase subunit K
VELILNAAILNLVAFARVGYGDVGGQVFGIFGIVLAAAEAVDALAIVLQLFRAMKSVDTADATELRE